MSDVTKVMRAAEFAARKHTHQRRKGEVGEPYLNHLIEVASLVAEAAEGQPDAVVAALLHDTVEDQGVSFDELVTLFGDKVASLVAEVTDDKSLPKRERKDRQVAHAPLLSPGACMIKLADKTSNLRSVALSPPPWPPARKLQYVNWAQAVVAGLPCKPGSLFAKFEGAVRLALASIDNEEARPGRVNCRD